MVEPYIPIGGQGVIGEHASYIPLYAFVLVDFYMIDGISFDECLEAAKNEVLEDRTTII